MRDEMEGLRQKAYMAQVAYEGKQEAKRRKKNEEEAKRRKEEARIRKGLLEAAFDDELDELIKLLQQGADFADDVVRVMPCSHQLGQPRPESRNAWHLIGTLDGQVTPHLQFSHAGTDSSQLLSPRHATQLGRYTRSTC